MQNTQPSPLIRDFLTGLARRGITRGVDAAMSRVQDFRSPLEARLTGVALDSEARQYANDFMDSQWLDTEQRRRLIDTFTDDREVIIGSGFHAAVYAATRVMMGYPRPWVIERNSRAGGTFAMTAAPTFYLNSRNRPGLGGLAGDLGASLNYLPGGLIQAASVGMQEFQTNADMAFAIRVALAQYANVVTAAPVNGAFRDGFQVTLDIEGFGTKRFARCIDARGLGDPTAKLVTNGTTVLTFPQFMQRMTQAWPLRNVRRVAVLGGGDSGKCAVESFLGIAPQPMMAAASLDHVERIDWYALGLPDRCKAWRKDQKGRYQAIGRYLRADRFGSRRLQTIDRSNAQVVALPDGALIEGRMYDLVVMCTGNRVFEIEGQDTYFFGPWNAGSQTVATKHNEMNVWRVGPHAQIPFDAIERQQGIAEIGGNIVSMFRTGTKTAALAATLNNVSADRSEDPEEVSEPEPFRGAGL